MIIRIATPIFIIFLQNKGTYSLPFYTVCDYIIDIACWASAIAKVSYTYNNIEVRILLITSATFDSCKLLPHTVERL